MKEFDFLLDCWQEKATYLRLLLLVVLTSAFFAIGKSNFILLLITRPNKWPTIFPNIKQLSWRRKKMTIVEYKNDLDS